MAKAPNHTLQDKMNAAMAYLLTGNSIEASKLCGIPERTIRNWSIEPWWADLIGEAKKNKNEELDATLTRIIHKVVGEIQDRVENGDEVLLKDGERVRKKITAKDAAVVSAILFDKRGIIRSEPVQASKNTNEKTRLEELANSLGDLGVSKRNTGKQGKVDTEDSLH